MTAKLDALFARVKTWPAARQAEAETLLEALEHRQPLGLSDAQAAEVERRLSEPAGRLMSLDEARARLADRPA